MIPFPPQSEDDGFLEDERRRLLPRLIPPLVHRMNNALAVIQGLGEFGAGSASSEAMTQEFEAARTLLGRLSSFSRTQPKISEAFDLRELVAGVCQFLRPFAESAGIGIEYREPLQAAVLRNNPLRVEQLVTVIVANELVALAEDGAADPASPRRVRLAVRQAPGRTVLTLVRPGAPSEEELSSALAQAARWADDNAASLYMRTLGEVTCYRFVFPSFEEFAPEDIAPGFVDQPRNLLLVEGDGPLCDLIKTVCSEAGYSITEVTDASFEPSAQDLAAVDLVLFDTDIELRRPGLLARIEALTEVTSLLLLGEVPDGAGSGRTPCLPKPFRPHELLAAVSRHLGAQVQQPE